MNIGCSQHWVFTPLCSFSLWFSSDAHFLVLSVVNKDRDRHPDWSVALQPHTQQPVIHCVFWHLSIRLMYSAIWATVEYIFHFSLLTCMSNPLITLSLVHYCSLLGPHLIYTDHCRAGIPHKSWLSYQTITIWPSSNSQIFKLAHFFFFLTT